MEASGLTKSRKEIPMPRSFALTGAAARSAAVALFMTPVFALSAAHADLERLDGAGITAALAGRTIGGERDGKTWAQTFDATGVTAYSVDGEAPTQGR
jgi:hypothetical protein